MGKTLGNEQLAAVFRAEFRGDRLAVGGRTGAEIDRDVEDRAAADADEFVLRMGRLLKRRPRKVPACAESE